MNGRTLALIIGSIAFTIPAGALAAHPSPSPLWNGTWHLNASHSRISSPGGKTSDTRTYRVIGNKVTLKSTGTNALGEPLQFTYSAAYDGKWYPMVGNPVGDSIAVTLVNPRRANARVKLHGTPSATSTVAVSTDGKHLTLTRRTLHAKSTPTVDVLEYDKAK